MESKKLGLNKWKLSTAILIVTLMSVYFVSLYQFESRSSFVSAQPNFIEVSISGPKKLNVNEAGQYQAVLAIPAKNSYSFTWSLSPQDNKTLFISNGDVCSLTFLSATEEPYLLSVIVKDLVVGNLGSASLTVYDPYTSPNLYLNSFSASYSYLVESDGVGWYRAVNGQTGDISVSSTNSSYVIQSAFNGLTVGRTWMETVQLIGNLGTVGTITVPSNTYIEGPATLSLLSTANYIFVGQGGTSPTTNVKIQGITFVNTYISSGRSTAPIAVDLSDNSAGVYGNYPASNISFIDNTFKDFRSALPGPATMIRGHYNNLLISNNNFINGAVVTQVGYPYTDTCFPIYISSGSSKINIVNNYFDCPQAGNHVYAFATTSLLVANNIFTGDPTSTVETICLAGVQDCLIEGNLIFDGGIAGVLVHSRDGDNADGAYEGASGEITIQGNVIAHSRSAINGGRGVWIGTDDAPYDMPSGNIYIKGNTIEDCGDGVVSGESWLPVNNVMEISGNTFVNCDQSYRLNNGTISMWNNKYVNTPAYIINVPLAKGYVDEGYYRVTHSGYASYVTHNLHGTPTWFSVYNSNPQAAGWTSAVGNSTIITIGSQNSWSGTMYVHALVIPVP